MNCLRFSSDAPPGIAQMLHGVDCATGQATAFAFDRLFGAHGTLTLALTAMLTLYVGLLAFNLITGRSTLSLSLLTPRALTLGLVLTFATSWVAYQHVVWNLASGAPDEIANLLIGGKGSATDLFAARLDHLFHAVTEAANAGATADTTDHANAASTAARSTAPVKPTDLLWYAAMLLLLGTAGVLIVARIALAALLAIGPVFILLALFDATRGLFEGWLKTAVLFALVPLLAVLEGGGGLLLLTPLVQPLTAPGAVPTMDQAVAIFLGACVYTALMVLSLKAATSLTSGWRLPGSNVVPAGAETVMAAANAAQQVRMTAPAAEISRDERIRQLVAAAQAPVHIATGFVPRANHALPALSTVSVTGRHERLRGLGAFHKKVVS